MYGLAMSSSSTSNNIDWYVLQHSPLLDEYSGFGVFGHPLFQEHAAFLGSLFERGWLVAAGPLDDAPGHGMTVIRVPDGVSANDVEQVATQDDPSVAGGLFSVSVRPWSVRMTMID